MGDLQAQELVSHLSMSDLALADGRMTRWPDEPMTRSPDSFGQPLHPPSHPTNGFLASSRRV
jgi:hypothetical protein